MSLDEKDKDIILRDILSTGFSSDENRRINAIIASRLQNSAVIQISSGLAKIRSNMKERFKLILSTPTILSRFNPFEIRCCLCNRVISYPCWYYNVKYNINHFHYFVCLNKSFGDKNEVNANCYKR